jgi:cell division septation protein DedD
VELAKRERFFDLPNVIVPVEEKGSPSPERSPEKIPPVARKRKRRRWRIPAVLVAFVFGLAALGYFTGFFDRFIPGKETVAVKMNAPDDDDKLVFGKRSKPDSLSATDVDTAREAISHELDERTSRQKALAIKETKTRPVAATEPESHVPVNSIAVTASKPYHIIGGAFLVPGNAERLKASLERKGFSPVILPKRGDYYMLSLGSFDTLEQATEAMRQLRGKLEQELWVMKK